MARKTENVEYLEMSTLGREIWRTDEEFEQYIKDTKEASAYEMDVELDKDSKIISLSTCTNVRDDERFLVQGVRVRTKKAGK